VVLSSLHFTSITIAHPWEMSYGALKESLPYSLIRFCKDIDFVAVFENNWWSLTLVTIPDYTLA